MRLKYRWQLRWRLVGSILGAALLVVGLVTGLGLSQRVSNFFSRATGKKALIVVEANKTLGSMPKMWNNLSQGGEEVGGMIKKASEKIIPLKPNYIRLDHIYDFFEVAQKDTDGKISYNWSKLDEEVRTILAVGAKPFLSLSYMPPALAAGVTDRPSDYFEWQQLVQATIEHYSGEQGMNIDQVYYEVWNEPDLFGKFKVYGKKNYLDLYRVSAIAAKNAKGVKKFKIGGPATTGMYRNWMEALFKMIEEENLRLDFISWHRYSLEPEMFGRDIEDLSKVIAKYPKLVLKERIISEWGFDANNHPGYDGSLGAAHLVATTRELLGKVQKAFVFEIMDGKSLDGKALWGRWGLVSHSSTGLIEKPRYKAYKWLNQLYSTRVYLSGEGSWVKAIAAKEDDNLQLYLVNYDSRESHWERVPVIVKNLSPGTYKMLKEGLDGSVEERIIEINSGTWSGEVLMSPNQVVRLTFSK